MISKRFIRAIFTVVLLAFVGVVAIGCDEKLKFDYTYNIYTAVSPSNWNELTYQDANDTQIMDYLGSRFFQFDFEFDDEGNPVPGKFQVVYSAATKLEDVSAQYEGEEWGIEEDATHRAYKITLRNDLKWDDGTAIKAEDFVYSMKEQLNPLFLHYRADSYYVGATIIHNAENYVKQGQKTYVDNYLDDDEDGEPVYRVPVADLVKGANGVYEQANGFGVKFVLKTGLLWCNNYTVTQYSAYLDPTAFAALEALADEKGEVPVTDETIALFATLIDTDDWGHEPEEYVSSYMLVEKEYDEMSFDKVGIFADGDYELVIILDKALVLLDAEGELTYRAAYNMSSLPLVKKSLYEKNKVKPEEGGTLWTTTYNNSVKSSASWGPYKLHTFQAGKEYLLVRNDKWFGYETEMYEGQYQTEAIHCETLEEWNSAWLKFQAGELDGIGIDVSIATEYKSSERAYYTPDDYVASLQLQENVAALKERETAGFNKSILGYLDFRKALSLSINRAEFAVQTTTSSLAGYGLFNSMHYYDVANGGVYRNEDVARQVLCDIYSVDVSKYDSLEDAEKSITGYDLDVARTLVTQAYEDALAAGDINETDVVKLTMGSSVINETVQRRFTYLQNAWKELVKTTPLEDRLDFDQQEKGSTWSNDFRNGAYDIVMGGWSGAAWDPGYFLLAYLSPDYMYSKNWPTDEIELTFTMVGGAADGSDVTDTLSLMDWYNCLNGKTSAKYKFGAGQLDDAKRLTLIAALEKEVLKVYYSVPLYNNYGASLLSYKVEYITYEYNTFMSYGGVRYMTYNYTNKEWDALVSEQAGHIDYKA